MKELLLRGGAHARILLEKAGFFESRCTACLEPFVPSREKVAHRFLCPSCRTHLERRRLGFCPYCGEPSALADAPCMPCGECLQKLPPWQEFLFFGLHEGLLRQLLLRGKLGGDLAALEFLGTLLAERCEEHYEAAPKPDFILPVPVHEQRLRERGFNQCRELARPMGRILGLPVYESILERVHDSGSQTHRSREERRQFHQPFALSEKEKGAVEGRHILLLDDVCTTGSTLRRAVECLLRAGAVRIDAVVLARTSRHGKKEL